MMFYNSKMSRTVTTAYLVCLTMTLAAAVESRPFEPVQFSCHGRGDKLRWLVNGRDINKADNQTRASISITDETEFNGTLSSSLTIIALPSNDRIRITCLVAYLVPSYDVTLHKVMKLEIRGILSVQNLTLNVTSSHDLIISWSPPAWHSRDVFGNYTYQFNVTNERGIPFKNGLGSVNSHTSAEVANITECDTFNVSVTAFLENYTSINYLERLNGSYAVTFNICLLHGNLTVQFKYIPSSPDCQSLLSININSDSKTHHNQALISVKSDEKMIYKLAPFMHYKVSVVLRNLQEETLYENHINISTFHVQDFFVSNDGNINGSVKVQCFFEFNIKPCDIDAFDEEPTIEECHVVFSTNDTVNDMSFNITGSNETLVTLCESGNYTVIVYDSINGSIIDDKPAVDPKKLEVIISSNPCIDSTSDTGTSKYRDPNRPLYIVGGIAVGTIILVILLLIVIIAIANFK